MASYRDFELAAPELAAAIAARFGAHLHHVMATLRRDGSPRVSGTEVRIIDGEAYLGSMPGARKAEDLVRDPRVAIHAAPIDVDLVEGDAKISGTAHVLDDAERLRFFTAVGLPEEHHDGVAFRVDVAAASLIRIVDDTMRIDTWTPTSGVTTTTR